MNSQRGLFGDQSQQEFEVLDGDETEARDEGQEGVWTGREANDYDPKTKSTKAFKEGELAIIIDHMDENLEKLTGHCREHEYKRIRTSAWAQLVADINRWNDQNGTGVIREPHFSPRQSKQFEEQE